jgi:hypothetical protein
MYRTVILLVALLGGYASAHQFTPTYPQLLNTYVEGVKVVNMTIFNSRKEISWYSLNVYDKDWNSLAFASSSKLINLEHLERKDIEIFIQNKDKDIVVKSPAIIMSRICSKIKRDTDETFNTYTTAK